MIALTNGQMERKRHRGRTRHWRLERPPRRSAIAVHGRSSRLASCGGSKAQSVGPKSRPAVDLRPEGAGGGGARAMAPMLSDLPPLWRLFCWTSSTMALRRSTWCKQTPIRKNERLE